MRAPANDVRVVWWRHADVAAAELAPYLGWLSEGETARLQRFRFEKDRTAFLASRILLRQVLAEVTGLAPPALRFSTDEHGVKPHLLGQPPDAPVHFSLTHTDTLVACALARHGAVGIDAEAWTRPVRVESLAPRVLSPAEAALVLPLDEPARSRRFLTYWTVKEACLKATGTGLRVAPASVEVRLDPTSTSDASAPAWHVSLSDPAADGAWQIRLFDDIADHALALTWARPVHPAEVTVSIAPFTRTPAVAHR